MSQVNVGQTKETELFFRQWLRSPKSMGAVIPSSRALARAVSQEIAWRPGQVIVELGAGTGAISQGLIDSGLPPEALMMIELDRPLFEYLRERFPKVRVINGDATRLVDILRQQGVGRGRHGDLRHPDGDDAARLSARDHRAELRRARPGRLPAAVLLFADRRRSPPRSSASRPGWSQFVVRNLPPATVWRFRPLSRQGSSIQWPGQRSRLTSRARFRDPGSPAQPAAPFPAGPDGRPRAAGSDP